MFRKIIKLVEHFFNINCFNAQFCEAKMLFKYIESLIINYLS